MSLIYLYGKLTDKIEKFKVATKEEQVQIVQNIIQQLEEATQFSEKDIAVKFLTDQLIGDFIVTSGAEVLSVSKSYAIENKIKIIKDLEYFMSYRKVLEYLQEKK